MRAKYEKICDGCGEPFFRLRAETGMCGPCSNTLPKGYKRVVEEYEDEIVEKGEENGQRDLTPLDVERLIGYIGWYQVHVDKAIKQKGWYHITALGYDRESGDLCTIKLSTNNLDNIRGLLEEAWNAR